MSRSSSQGSWAESSRSGTPPPLVAEDAGGSEMRLRGHAGVVAAFTADQVLLDDRDLQPAIGQAPRANLAGGAGAEHDHVVGMLAHGDTIPTPYPEPVQSKAQCTGATGFDVVDSCERLQVEVVGGLVKPRHQTNTCGPWVPPRRLARN